MANARCDKPYARLCSALVLVAACGAGSVSAQTVEYDQGDYRIRTTLDERFLGRDIFGTPISTGSFLYEGQLRSSPLFGNVWTVGVDPQFSTIEDVWEGSVAGEPGSLISSVVVQPVWSAYLDYWHALRGFLRFEMFSDPGRTNLLATDQLTIDWYTQGPKNINEFGVYYLGASFASGLSDVYLRFTQEITWSYHSVFYANGAQSHAESRLFELSAGTVAATTAPIPEPETYAMLLAGLGVLGFVARRRKLKESATA